MRYLRKLEGKTKRDMVTIRARLKIAPLQHQIEATQLRWFGYVSRMEEERISKKVWQDRPEGKRPKGRPRQTWEESIRIILKGRGIGKNEAKILAKDRLKWRARCKTSTPNGRGEPTK